LELIQNRAEKDFPNVRVHSYSPPYKPVFSDEDNKKIIDTINDCEPDVLFIGMTAPKQEKWVFKNEGDLKVGTICSIGAVFDFYAGTVKRSGPIWIKLGLEWLPRFLREPKRLAERNLISSPKFIIEVLSFKLFGKGILSQKL
jgi:N-acetylglucosaminyldiphosphoundecaprenol N-acetyl-beta-D-mannosaminyltransferase